MIDVLYEDNHLIAVNKKSGTLVQGDKTGDTPLIDLTKSYIKKKYDKPGLVFLGSPHRIDRPTSGIVVFTKTSKALSRMNKLFEQKEIQKTYWAVVKNKPQQMQGVLIDYLVRNQQKNKSFVSQNTKQGKKAELSYSVIKTLQNYYLLEVLPKTGRHHQIRVQLSAIQCPIKGDLKYGFDRSNKDASIHLHAREIRFIHPVSKEEIKITAPPPLHDSLWKACLSNT